MELVAPKMTTAVSGVSPGPPLKVIWGLAGCSGADWAQAGWLPKQQKGRVEQRRSKALRQRQYDKSSASMTPALLFVDEIEQSRRLKLLAELSDSFFRQVDILRFDLVAHILAVVQESRDGRLAAAHEGVEHHFVLVGVKLDEAVGQLQRKGGRMAHARAETAGKFQMLLVSSRKSSREMVAFLCGFLREKLALQKISRYSCTSRSVGLAGERQEPQAVEGEALEALFQMISPRIRKPWVSMSRTMKAWRGI